MIQIILIGLLIGLCISVPVGPLGILTIQRTFSRGRWHGIATGLGATTSDLIYASFVGFSMNLITSFISTHHSTIQAIGSIVIILLGIYFYRANPTKNLHTNMVNTKTTLIQDYATGFLLCFSNPTIVFLFIGLFAHFNYFNNPSPYQDIVAMSSILLGAFSWWTTITFVVNKFRSRFNLRGLEILNHISGLVFVLLGIIGLVKALIKLF